MGCKIGEIIKSLVVVLIITLFICNVESVSAMESENQNAVVGNEASQNTESLTDIDSSFSADTVLRTYGMPDDEIASLDADIKEFMAADLLSGDSGQGFEYIDTEIVNVPTPYVNQVLYDISFTVSAFKYGDVIYIFPTYEFTANKKPAGNDSFSVQVGDAMIPYDYGGQLWYKDDSMSEWVADGTLTANTQTSNGAEYSGLQLGSPDWSMKLKGCTYIHAQAGSGSSKQIIMSYMYNPNKSSYSISFSAYGVGIVYNASETIYTAAKTVILDY